MMEYSILFMNALTPLHNGAGEGLGIIDRPIIRERITNFPFLHGSSLKGTLRDKYSEKLNTDSKKNEKIEALFGPEKGDLHSGAVSFGDGNLLFFPVRSLQGCFVWATSPLLLYRLERFLEVSGKLNSFTNLKSLLSNPTIHSEMTKVLINPDSSDLLLVGKKPQAGMDDTRKIILEEFPKLVHPIDELKKFAGEIAGKVFTSQSSSFLKAEFIKKLVILPENTFRYFVTHATEVVPNIKIDDETGTSSQGLRYTEYLPSESILYTLIPSQIYPLHTFNNPVI